LKPGNSIRKAPEIDRHLCRDDIGDGAACEQDCNSAAAESFNRRHVRAGCAGPRHISPARRMPGRLDRPQICAASPGRKSFVPVLAARQAIRRSSRSIVVGRASQGASPSPGKRPADCRCSQGPAQTPRTERSSHTLLACCSSSQTSEQNLQAERYHRVSRRHLGRPRGHPCCVR